MRTTYRGSPAKDVNRFQTSNNLFFEQFVSPLVISTMENPNMQKKNFLKFILISKNRFQKGYQNGHFSLFTLKTSTIFRHLKIYFSNHLYTHPLLISTMLIPNMSKFLIFEFVFISKNRFQKVYQNWHFTRSAACLIIYKSCKTCPI
jgi:hypothetical protein